jgi:hypothetical protein
MSPIPLSSQHHSAAGTVFDQMAECLGGIFQLIRACDDRRHRSRGQQGQKGGPCCPC